MRVNTDEQPSVDVSTVYIPSNIHMTGTGYLKLPCGPFVLDEAFEGAIRVRTE